MLTFGLLLVQIYEAQR
ncbi:hypothetical protein [Schleiferilactobacillus harbinensis]